MWAQVDLVSTVGEVAALGASGVVMWGSSSDYDSQVNAVLVRLLQNHQERRFWTGPDPVPDL